MLAEKENFAGLARMNRELIGKVEALDSVQRIVLDMDSTEIPVYGEQENRAYNATSNRPAITRCYCSIGKVTVWLPSSGPATSTAPTNGTNCSCPRSSGNRSWVKRSCFGPTPLLPNRRSTKRWKSGA
jgi:hypothetical protein